MVQPSMPPKKIIWAVDAFEEIGMPQQHAAEAIRCLRECCQAVVQPVHILSPAELNLSSEFAGPWVSQYRPAAEKALNSLMKELGLTDLEPPQILIQNASSTAKAADMLSDFAVQQGAEMIVVGTHGRSGMSRLLLGSFAETLLLRSRVPVMVVGPRTHERCDFERMLFPTEFGDQSKSIFKRVVALARDFHSKITLFHAIPRPIEPVFQSGVYLLGSPWIPVHEYYDRELARHRRHAESWARWAKNQGVETEVVIDTETINVAESIVSLARKQRAGWIAMAAHNGPIASALLGSVTRQVIRIADCPVWVLRWPKSARGRKGAPAKEAEGKKRAAA
jgi:nucleotide-binding universal stress UspA family protein